MIEHVLDASTHPGFIASIVLREFVWVLESSYGYRLEQIAETFQYPFEVGRFQLESSSLVWRALPGYRADADFTDASLARVYDQTGCDYAASFDRKAARLNQIRLLSR